MSLRIAINGYGRIGRCLFRALNESPLGERIRVVAINEPADLDSIAYLTRFDSTHGRFRGQVGVADGSLVVDGARIPVTHADAPEGVPWRDFGVDVLVDCSGQYAARRDLERFLAAGCPRLLLSHPAHSAADVDCTAVFGINHRDLTADARIVSAGSCTTNAIVPVLALLDQAFGIERASMTTLHSVMNDQPLIDGYHHAELRRTRSAMQSMIPVSTGLARGIERLMPKLAGRIEAKAIRVPVLNVSAIDLTVALAREATPAAINACMADAGAGEFSGLLACSDEPHASIDFNHSPQSAIIDGGQTRVAGGRQASLLVWFDNEWGFANRMIELAAHWQRLLEARHA